MLFLLVVIQHNDNEKMYFVREINMNYDLTSWSTKSLIFNTCKVETVIFKMCLIFFHV